MSLCLINGCESPRDRRSDAANDSSQTYPKYSARLIKFNSCTSTCSVNESQKRFRHENIDICARRSCFVLITLTANITSLMVGKCRIKWPCITAVYVWELEIEIGKPSYNHVMTSSNGNIFRITGPLCGEFPSQRPVTRSFDGFFDLSLNKRLSKQSWCRWFETPYIVLITWRHCNQSNRSPED